MYDSLYRNVPKTSEEQKLNILNRNLEIWVFFSRIMVSIVVIDRKNKLSKRCVDNNNSQRIIHFCRFYTVLHCLVRPCVRWSLTGGWKLYKILKLSAEKVVAVAYGRWWFMRGSSIRFWLRIFLVFWKGGGLREVVVHGGLTVLFSNLLFIRSVSNPTHMYLSELIVYFKVEVYFRVTWSRM